jgi:uncharacterized protein YraI
MKKFPLVAIAAGCLSVGLAAAPLGAQAAEATSSVNVRSGPGTQYSVLDTLRPGEQVEIDRCASNGWCFVIKSGPDGWVSANYLTDDRRNTPSRSTRPDVDFSFSFSFGRGNGFSIGQPPRGTRRDLVCLVTFERRDQVAAGRDADVVRAEVMSLEQAERRDRPNDRQAIFDYGTNQQTRDTCRYLDRLN